MNCWIATLLILPVMTQNPPAASSFAPKELPYAYDALAPQLSEETLRYHHDKHYAGYVAKLNELVAGTPQAGQPLVELVRTAEGPVYNNAAQMWNHEFYFDQLSPAPAPQPTGRLLEAIERRFGSVDELKKQMDKASVGLFGSGWTWLVADTAGELSLVATPNAGNPLREGLTPLLCVDVWEHAYYIDYRNRRAEAVASLWQLIDWKVVGERYDAACA
ncbi:MAG: superoxide dismutase [Alistipes sp.]|nr:superoxide dismutase [Alistipes sp.]